MIRTPGAPRRRPGRMRPSLGPAPLAVLLVLVLALTDCGREELQPPAYWPTAEWRTSTPEEQGVSSARLADAVDYIAGHGLPVHSLLVVRHGYVALDAYFNGFSPGTPHDVASITKSVVSTLVGIAVDQERLKGVDQKVLEFFPGVEAANLDARKQQMAIRDLLTMRSGLECVAQPTEVTLARMMQSPDWVRFVLDLPMADEPGRTFVYNSGAVHLLSALLTQATGASAADYAGERLFAPLGIHPGVWPYGPQKRYSRGWGDLHLTPHDLARLGLLFLQRGRWEDRQVVSAQWIAAATERQVSLKGDAGYGYLWWITGKPRGMFEARGRGGQRLVVWPEKEAVVVITGGGVDPAPLAPFLLAALQSDATLPPSADGTALLSQALRRAASMATAPASPAVPAPAAAHRISGRTYALEANPFGIEELTFTFRDPEEALLLLKLAHHAEEGRIAKFVIGLDGSPRTAPGRFGLPATGVGQWTTDDTFEAEIDEIANINRFHVRLAFRAESMSGMLEEKTGLGTGELRGRIKE